MKVEEVKAGLSAPAERSELDRAAVVLSVPGSDFTTLSLNIQIFFEVTASNVTGRKGENTDLVRVSI